jgi:hypothetical protein
MFLCQLSRFPFLYITQKTPRYTRILPSPLEALKDKSHNSARIGPFRVSSSPKCITEGEADRLLEQTTDRHHIQPQKTFAKGYPTVIASGKVRDHSQVIFFLDSVTGFGYKRSLFAQIAQSVEQRTENPRVGSSILSLGTSYQKGRS